MVLTPPDERLWAASLALELAAAVALLTIAFLLARGLRNARQFGRNPLATATTTVFLACGLAYALHAALLAAPSLGPHPAGEAARTAATHWTAWLTDAVVAATATAYLVLRSTTLLRSKGPQLFENAQQRQALQLHDNVVQHLARAKLAHETNDPSLGAALDDALRSSKRIITELLGDTPEDAVRNGALRRDVPS